MVQEVINVGAFANDGTGDPLRTALLKTNNNFSRLFSTVGSVDTYTTNTPGANLVLQPTFNANVLIGVGSALVANATWFTGMTANNATFYGQITTNGVYPIIGNLSGTASTATIATTALYATTAGTAINAQNFTGNNLPNVNTIGNLIAANIAIANIGTLYSNSNIYATGNLTTSGFVTGNGYYLSGLSGITPSSYGNTNVAAYLTTYSGNLTAGNINLTSNVYATNIVSNTLTTLSGSGANLTIDPDGIADLVISAATEVYILSAAASNSYTNGALVTLGGVGVTGNINASGNVNAANLTATSNIKVTGGNVYAGNLLSQYDIIVGPPGTVPTANLTAQFVDNSNYYTQINIQNIGNGSSTSADVVATANDGSDTANYIDMGINSNNYSDPSFTIGTAHDGYLYVNGGNISLGTQTSGKAIVFHTDGTLAANEAGRITSSRWVIGGSDDATNKLQVTGTARFNSNVTVANITSTGNVTASYHFGNGSTLTGLYGNSQASAYIGTYLPTYTGNLTAGNLVATGNVGGTFFIGNGSLLTGMYSNIQAAAYLPTYSGNINGGNVNATGNAYATYFVGSSQYLTGLYSNASVANYLPTYYTNANIAANGVSSTSYILGYISINGYAFANLANTTGNTTTLYGNVSTLILDYTLGQTVAVANVYLPANANISDGTKITISSNINVSSLRIIANDSSVSGNISSITPTTPASWHYVKYAPYNGSPTPQQLPGGPRWIRVG